MGQTHFGPGRVAERVGIVEGDWRKAVVKQGGKTKERKGKERETESRLGKDFQPSSAFSFSHLVIHSVYSFIWTPYCCYLSPKLFQASSLSSSWFPIRILILPSSTSTTASTSSEAKNSIERKICCLCDFPFLYLFFLAFVVYICHNCLVWFGLDLVLPLLLGLPSLIFLLRLHRRPAYCVMMTKCRRQSWPKRWWQQSQCPAMAPWWMIDLHSQARARDRVFDAFKGLESGAITSQRVYYRLSKKERFTSRQIYQSCLRLRRGGRFQRSGLGISIIMAISKWDKISVGFFFLAKSIAKSTSLLRMFTMRYRFLEIRKI